MIWSFIQPLGKASTIMFIVYYIPLSLSLMAGSKINKIHTALALVGIIPSVITMIIFMVNLIVCGIAKACNVF